MTRAHTGRVLSVDLALRLRDAGLRWTPASGDRFVLPNRGMDSEVFVLADMTVEVHEFPTGKVIGFNGVTEWALDSVDKDDALWLPAEHQLRALLANMFVRLQPLEPGPGFGVTIKLPDDERTFTSNDAEDAYAGALLAVLHFVGESPTAEQHPPGREPRPLGPAGRAGRADSAV